MKRWKDRILQVQFGRLVKRLAILSVCVVLAGGALSAVLLQPQIAQIVSAAQQSERMDGFHDEHVPDWEGWDDVRGVTEPTRPVKAVLLAVGAAWCALAALWWLLIPAWLCQAANRARMNPLLWPLLGLFWSLWGLLLSLVARSLLRQWCSSCGTWQRKASFCRTCGAGFHVTCPSCGTDCAPDDAYCGHCGAALHSADPAEHAETADETR